MKDQNNTPEKEARERDDEIFFGAKVHQNQQDADVNTEEDDAFRFGAPVTATEAKKAEQREEKSEDAREREDEVFFGAKLDPEPGDDVNAEKDDRFRFDAPDEE
ncbi:hypothetical protein [Eubacterium sp. 1001713B170207_170306_E7]|uniref:hypothetical protein n=1 Tax=Eubacterium sp. 1001713B170207_170306_E7 TaxID=2787097 RepID=UPI00189B6B59|nr:hypothetical protein [Eubacterium sp. 1001713B170207_170306_E7]